MFLSSPMFDVKTYQIEGNSYYTDDEILVMGNCQTGGNIFWGSGVGEIKKRLSKDTYMEEVTVKRSLPDTLIIQITERKQTAAIIYGDEYVVIDSNGIILRRTDVEPKIPVIQGLTISKLKVGQEIETEEKVLLRQTLELLNSMEEGDLFFKRISISDLQIRAYIYDSLICEGTPENLMEAIESGKLQLVIQELLDRDIERGVIQVSGEDYISFSPKID